MAIDRLIYKDMKKINLEHLIELFDNLETSKSEVKVPKAIAEKATIPLNRMLNLS
ncbi:MAG: hypothetical protein GF383_06935 [Candidatus Lokiarchaeota archaeon]|nr:hypothetical protein [Candidatus Lokiarchaeota archaeon]MBD3339884.1 hypothetical protein [Candidatus Lokiarchaeota archaeon]